jgi:hypothetical protein
MHRSRAPSIAPGTFFVAQPWADCITNMPEFNLRQAHHLIVLDEEHLLWAVGIGSLATPQRSEIELLTSQIYCPFATRAA